MPYCLKCGKFVENTTEFETGCEVPDSHCCDDCLTTQDEWNEWCMEEYKKGSYCSICGEFISNPENAEELEKHSNYKCEKN